MASRHAALLVEHRENLFSGNPGELHAVRAQLRGQILRQPARRLLVAERLDEGRAMFLVEFQFPRSLRRVLVPVDERGRVPALREREVLNVDYGTWQIEVGPVLALLGGRGVVLVEALVFVADTVQVEEVCDGAFLETPDQLPLQGADLLVADVVVVLAP